MLQRNGCGHCAGDLYDTWHGELKCFQCSRITTNGNAPAVTRALPEVNHASDDYYQHTTEAARST